ncbi:MAG: 3-hydroxyacyl-CoA dehydrogenase [Rhodospirillaceae bacterium]|nr:3-hydroxyacyl-CoA dehydrogenase [Rhodospirillaceae bacterium]MBT5566706.1 3-hydroxyacyl-CoA dehydrogenase [Rhodospirillaceae bacterium]MBT6090757.1 3-hydroxyacyl-CoA dehydrogenase [Rhodospirillaceae bacterium]
MSVLLEYSVDNGIAVLVIDNPPVNALSQQVRQAIRESITAAEADDGVKAVVIACTGRTFSAGADIREFDAPVKDPSLPILNDFIESGTKPVVAALHGTTLGGGLELAMSCHYRVALTGTRVGLPEVHLGLIPGAGGTQRLPRLIGAEAAIEAITTGRHIPADEALGMGLLDDVVEDDVLQAAVSAAHRLVGEGHLSRTGDRDVNPESVQDGMFSKAKAVLAKRRRGFDAPQAAVDAIEWACATPITEGLQKERSCSNTLKASLQSKAQRHLFFAERLALKIPDIPKDTPLLDIATTGVIGAGTMGAGIAICLLNADLPVVLVETKQEALDRGLERIKKTLDRDVGRGRLASETRDARLARLTGALSLETLGSVDFVVEAAFESMQVKKQIFVELDTICKATAVLATNTSTLDINDIAAVTKSPDRVIGTHFFSPANVMKLLEVVRGTKTAKGVVATTMKLGRRIGKVPALSGVGYGFIGNRMLEDYVRESQMLLLDGASPAQVDRALEAWGMAMGPCAVMDLAGQDVSFLTRDQNRDLLPNDPLYCVPGDIMNAEGRLGQKTGKGFYQYPDGRTRQNDPEAIGLVSAAAEKLGVANRDKISDQEILDRCLHALINRGAQLLDDGIALRSSDIDVVWSAGYGFPAYRGGPMFYADSIGLDAIVQSFEEMAKTFGNEYGYWTPAPLLVKLATSGQTFADYDTDQRGDT